jgi:RNA polymerase sigma-70 factor (ECF subfamily)
MVGRPDTPDQERPNGVPTVPAASIGFAGVVEAHWSAVFRFLLAMTGNHHDTEELTQETFLRALRRFDSFQPGTQMRPWLLRIAANACTDLWRQRKRVKWAPLADEPPAPAVDPGHRLETIEEAQVLQAAVDELSETTRAVFHLRVQESMPFRQIGELLGLNEDAARWHMHQARSKLLARAKRD